MVFQYGVQCKVFGSKQGFTNEFISFWNKVWLEKKSKSFIIGTNLGEVPAKNWSIVFYQKGNALVNFLVVNFAGKSCDTMWQQVLEKIVSKLTI